MGFPGAAENLDSDTVSHPEVVRGLDPAFGMCWDTPRRSSVTRNLDLRRGKTGSRDVVRLPVPVVIATLLIRRTAKTCHLATATTRDLVIATAWLGDLTARWNRELLRQLAIAMEMSGKLGKVNRDLRRVNETTNVLVTKADLVNRWWEGLVTREMETRIKKGSRGKWEQ